MSERFKRIASRHTFRVAFQPGRKLKKIKSICQETIGERQEHIVYRIPCDCQRSLYVGETWRLFQTRKNEHVSKVRLANRDMAQGKLSSAEQRMGKEDGGLARHSVECTGNIDWESAKIVGRKTVLRQKKGRKGIESLRERHYGIRILNNHDQLEMWKPILNDYFELERKHIFPRL